MIQASTQRRADDTHTHTLQTSDDCQPCFWYVPTTFMSRVSYSPSHWMVVDWCALGWWVRGRGTFLLCMCLCSGVRPSESWLVLVLCACICSPRRKERREGSPARGRTHVDARWNDRLLRRIPISLRGRDPSPRNLGVCDATRSENVPRTND